MSFLLRRFAASLAQIVAASLFAFGLFSLAPGDFYSGERLNPQSSVSTIESLREQSGLRDPWFQRYGAWVRSCVRGEFGVSIAYRMPVGELAAPRIRATLSIAIPALLLAWLGGLALAFAVQHWPALALDSAESAASSAALVPGVITISLLLWIAVRLGVPIAGPELPILGLTAAILPVVFLHATSGLASARDLLFVRMARQRGIAGPTLWFRYILPAAANPLVTLLGLSVTATISASLLVEVLTGWPGAGPLFLDAVQSRDYAIVQSVIFMLAIVLSLSNLAVDLILYRLDPRIRLPR